MIYKNEIKSSNSKNLTNKEIKNINMINEKAKRLLINQASNKIAYFMMMYFKYNQIDNTSYDILAWSSLENNIFLSHDINVAIEKSKRILNKKYAINIESTKPLILSTKIPFNEINEKL